MKRSAADGRSLKMLAAGSMIAIMLGSLAALGWGSANSLSPLVAARVNDTDIRQVEYQRALKLFASEKRDPLTDADRSLVLERLIEEELLIQHGVSTGLVREDRGVRAAVLQSMLTGLMAELEAKSGAKEEGAKEAADGFKGAALKNYLAQMREAANIRWAAGGLANE